MKDCIARPELRAPSREVIDGLCRCMHEPDVWNRTAACRAAGERLGAEPDSALVPILERYLMGGAPEQEKAARGLLEVRMLAGHGGAYVPLLRTPWLRELRDRPDTADDAAHRLAVSLTMADDPALRAELLDFARARARAKLDACSSERVGGWRVLEAMGELKRGLLRADAVALLGAPTRITGNSLIWQGTANPCHVIETLTLRFGRGGRVEEITR